jgi:hypothetical protein
MGIDEMWREALAASAKMAGGEEEGPCLLPTLSDRVHRRTYLLGVFVGFFLHCAHL